MILTKSTLIVFLFSCKFKSNPCLFSDRHHYDISLLWSQPFPHLTIYTLSICQCVLLLGEIQPKHQFYQISVMLQSQKCASGSWECCGWSTNSAVIYKQGHRFISIMTSILPRAAQTSGSKMSRSDEGVRGWE